jgi:FkbM family methyltransferase
MIRPDARFRLSQPMITLGRSWIRFCDLLRLFRDRLSVLVFRTRIVTHRYGGIPLTLRISDPIAKTWYDQEWNELPEVTFLKNRKLRPGAKVFELGAHQAQMALLLAKIVGTRGAVIALEASRYNCGIAAENIALNQVSNLKLINSAVSGHDGKIRFNECINGRIGCGRKVHCLSIDTLAITYGLPDLVFLDVEGYELEVLRGAGKTLMSPVDWFVEVHAGCGLESFGGSAEAIVDLFRLRHYSLFVQTDEHYRQRFQPLAHIPKGRFFLIACNDNSP